MAKVTSMMNIGKEMERKLSSIGITSAEQLMAAGAKEAFAKMNERYPNVCLVHLYTLEGAVSQTDSALWEYIRRSGGPSLKLTFAEIERIAGLPIDHSFLRYKKELTEYGWQVGKISMKEQTVTFNKMD